MYILILLIIIFIQNSRPQSQQVQDVCGRSLKSCPSNVNLRVTGGQSTCAERTPWNVLIEHINLRDRAQDGGVYPYCAGVLITERHVLSAAHCYWSNTNQFGICPEQFENSTAEVCKSSQCPRACTRVGTDELLLYLGLTNRLQPGLGDTRTVEKIDLHPGWDRGDRLNDILQGHDLALLTLRSSVDILNPTTIPVCLPFSFSSEDVESGLVSGFGVVVSPRDGRKSHPILLQTASVDLKSKESCVELWNFRGNQLCALGSKVLSVPGADEALSILADSCNGDSGGGLTASGPNNREFLLGITSFGEPECGRLGGKPGVYTNVKEHLPWIQARINNQDGVGTGGTGTGSQACFTQAGKRCVFPFKFKEKIFASCTTEFDEEGLAWCSTKTNLKGDHIVGEGEWGHCPSSCPVDILNTPGGGRPNPLTVGSSWGVWSPCSSTCGEGTRSRSKSGVCPRNSEDCVERETESCYGSPCSSVPLSEWTSWSACSRTCGSGTQTRTLSGTQFAQQRGCKTEDCSNSRPSTDDDFQSLWILGGTEEIGFIESFTPNLEGSADIRPLNPLPAQRDSCIGATVEGRVYVCGGSSGVFGDSVVHNTCFTKLAKYPERSWQFAPSMPYNTSHAASAVYNSDLYVFGGYTKPVCGYKPQVQVFSHSNQKWAGEPGLDPPNHIGGYGCAATFENRIYVAGGYFTDDVYSTRCEEKESDEQLTTSNRLLENYVDYLQILDPKTRTWSQGPSMIRPRRNHGCSIVTYQGRKGFLVAGGYNSKEYFLKAVEFLPLELGVGKWESLPDMQQYRGSRMGVLSKGLTIYVVSGDLEGNGTLIETLAGYQTSWTTLGTRLLREKSYATFIPV